MKILVCDIPEKGIQINTTVDACDLDISPSEVVLDDRVYIDALITREGDTFFVDGGIKTALHLLCSRCGVEFSYPVETSFHSHEEPVSKASREIELELHTEDMDVDHYSGEEVEINDLFREQVILSVPMHPLCKLDCLGLCPRCGRNLNVNKCDCPPQEIEHPFAVLKKVLS